MPKLLFLLIHIICCLKTVAQAISADSTSSNINGLLNIYTTNTKINPLLYNGKQYLYNYRDIKGDPFLFTNVPTNGAVKYDGIYFYQATLSYDIVTDDLVVYPENNPTGIVLQKERVASFEMNSHKFYQLYQLTADSTNQSLGFFEQLFLGSPASAFIRHEKTVVDPGANSGEQRELRGRMTYFIQRNGKLYKIKGQASLLDALNDKRDEIRSFIKEQHIDLKNNTGSGIIKILTRYQQN